MKPHSGGVTPSPVRKSTATVKPKRRRGAHAHVCLILMHRLSLPHKELATLIDTMQAGAKAFTIVISPEVWRIQIDTVELIDYAATRMSAAL